jgi:hypothetical protein
MASHYAPSMFCCDLHPSYLVLVLRAFVRGGLKTTVLTAQIYDTASGECVFDAPPTDPAAGVPEPAAGAAVWALSVRPDGKGFMSGGADQRVTFWDFVVREALLVRHLNTVQ